MVLFSHPADFTPVCTTELGKTAALGGEFAKRGVKPIAVSVDPLEQHQSWVNDINETQNCSVQFPILADADRKVSELYDLIHPNASTTATVRSLFVIDPQKKVRLIITYPASTGRNFDEILRALDSIQMTAKHKVATPANWVPGQDVGPARPRQLRLHPSASPVRSHYRTAVRPGAPRAWNNRAERPGPHNARPTSIAPCAVDPCRKQERTMPIPITGRIARQSARRPWLTLSVWAALLVVALMSTGTIGEHVTSAQKNLVTTEADRVAELDADLRASAGYRTRVAANLLRKFWLETRTHAPFIIGGVPDSDTATVRRSVPSSDWPSGSRKNGHDFKKSRCLVKATL